MTPTSVTAMIRSTGIPSAYLKFPDGTDQAPPYICYYFGIDNDFYADGSNYVNIADLTIELYTATKDFTMEKAVETALRSNGLKWTREESDVEDEKLYMVRYMTEVVMNEEDTNNG